MSEEGDSDITYTSVNEQRTRKEQVPGDNRANGNAKANNSHQESLSHRQWLSSRLMMLQQEERALHGIIIHLRHQHSKLAIEKVRLMQESKKYIKTDGDDCADEEGDEWETDDEEECDIYAEESDSTSSICTAKPDVSANLPRTANSPNAVWMKSEHKNEAAYDLRHNAANVESHDNNIDISFL